ncbi:MAG: hypothetical protein U1A27_07135 [Phycisphaerae bacterium]
MAEGVDQPGPQFLGDPVPQPPGSTPPARDLVAADPPTYGLAPPPAPARRMAPVLQAGPRIVSPQGRAAAVARVSARPRANYRVEGFICLLIAASWFYGATRLYDHIGTQAVMRLMSRQFRLQPKASPPPAASAVPDAEPAADPAPPDERVQPRGKPLSFLPAPRTAARGATPSARSSTALRDFSSATGAARSTPVDSPDALRAESERLLREFSIAEGTRLAWALLTCLLAGLITAAALNAITRTMAARLVWFGLLAGALGTGAGGLAVARFTRVVPTGERWLDWIVNISQTAYAWAGLLTIGLAVATVAALFSLRPAAHPRRWMNAAAVLVAVGTAATLVGIMVLENYAHFPPLPGWVYGAATAAQALLGLPLVILLQDRSRHPLEAPA